MSITDNRKKLSTWVQIGLGLSVLVVVAPIAFSLLQATVALIATLLLGLATVFFAPAVGDWFAAKRLKSIKAVAAANPIETLEQNLIQARTVIKERKQAMGAYDAAMAKFIADAKLVIARQPAKQQALLEQIAKRQALRAKRIDMIKVDEIRLLEAQNQLEALRAEHSMAMAAKAVDGAGDRFMDDQRFDPMRVEAAISSIESSVHESMASHSTIFADMDFDPNKALTADDDAMKYAMQALNIPSTQKVLR